MPEQSRRLVLLVDDCRDSNATWAILLRMWGFEVELAGDGETAVRAARLKMPAAVLLDIGLPGADGYEVARHIRALHGPRPLLIALTGRSQPLDLIAANEVDFDLHLIKPADPDRIRTILETYCNGLKAQAKDEGSLSPMAAVAS